MKQNPKFLKGFESYCRNENLFASRDRIVVAVSGGMDSMVLLHCLHSLSTQYQMKLISAHLNHKLRGNEGDEDEDFVREHCLKLNVPFICAVKDAAEFARENKLSLEAAAREVRYDFLERTRVENQFDKIATGHHADDQAETVLFNLFRGSGWRGMRGILSKRDAIVRPLLFASRSEIKKFAETTGIVFRQDASNASLDFKRNQIRHQLLPLIKKEMNPKISARLNDFGRIFREGDEYFRSMAEEALKQCLVDQSDSKFTLDIGRFCTYFTIIQKYILFHVLSEAGFSPDVLSFRQLESILELIHKRRSGRWHALPDGWKIGVDHSGIVLVKAPISESVQRVVVIGQKISVPERNILFSCEYASLDGLRYAEDATVEFVDGDKLAGANCEIRSVREGDYFFPLGLGHRQKLSDFFINNKVPFMERSRVLVFTCQDDVVWVCGHRLDHRFRVTSKTRDVVRLKIENG